jgi:hypothetical protein
MFSVAGRDGLLPTVSAFLHIKRLTPVVPCIVEGTLGIKSEFYISFHMISSRYSLCTRW